MPETASNGYDLIIVGAGPAGLTAAMYAGRGMLQAVTIERGAPGGELLNTDLIEDYPGFESVKGWELAQKMHDHAKKFGAEIVTDMVESVRKGGDGVFEVRTARGRVYRAPTVILTAGGTPAKVGGPGGKEDAEGAGPSGGGGSGGGGGPPAKGGGGFGFHGLRAQSRPRPGARGARRGWFFRPRRPHDAPPARAVRWGGRADPAHPPDHDRRGRR